jgi:atypical dual specificity phosphatase
MRITWLREGEIAASGMPYGADLEALGTFGIGAVLSLSMSSPFSGGPPDGIEHHHEPIPDMTAPADDSIERAVAFLRQQRESGRATLVHCAAGYGRTGTMLACYLVSEGLAAGEAIAEVRSARPGSVETYEQERCIRDYAARREAGDA